MQSDESGFAALGKQGCPALSGLSQMRATVSSTGSNDSMFASSLSQRFAFGSGTSRQANGLYDADLFWCRDTKSSRDTAPSGSLRARSWSAARWREAETSGSAIIRAAWAASRISLLAACSCSSAAWRRSSILWMSSSGRALKAFPPSRVFGSRELCLDRRESRLGTRDNRREISRGPPSGAEVCILARQIARARANKSTMT
jgi:hypothetical protein